MSSLRKIDGLAGKKCYNCAHCFYVGPGIDINFQTIPPAWECINPEVDFKIFCDYDWNTLPFYCQHYDPVLIKYCVNCNEPMNQPEYCWPIWSDAFMETYPLCSKICFEEDLKNDFLQVERVTINKCFYSIGGLDEKEEEDED